MYKIRDDSRSFPRWSAATFKGRFKPHMLDLLRALRGPAIGRMMLSIGRMVGDRTKSDLAEADLLRFTWMLLS